jgi:hypothetical protein
MPRRAKEIIMKKIFSSVALALAFTATAVYAAAGHSAPVTFYETVHIGADSLPAGDYTIHWADGPGVVDLTITGNKHKLTVPVTISSHNAANGDQVIITGDDKATVLQGFAVKSQTLTIKTDSATTATK